MNFNDRNSPDLATAFDSIDEKFIEILYGGERANLLKQVGEKLTAHVDKAKKEITPPVDLIFNAFRLCSYDNIKCVVVGQDPYPKKGDAIGVSFATLRERRTPISLAKIYECLDINGMIGGLPSHPDITGWAKQGVLLLNLTLTTDVGESNAHKSYWRDYMNAVIRELSRCAIKDDKKLIWMLWGNDAQSISGIIHLGVSDYFKSIGEPVNKSHMVLEWGHPSPMNSANKSDNPKNFKYCNHFERANDLLREWGKKEINWDPDYTE